MKRRNAKTPTKTLARKANFRASYFHCSTHRRICQYFFAILGLFASITSLIPVQNAAATSTNRLYFTNFEADYYLTHTADNLANLHVVEEITAVFPENGENHGLLRVIPFTAADGKQITTADTSHLQIEVERNGLPENISKIEVDDGYFRVYIGDVDEFIYGEQIYTLTYDYVNVITNQSADDKSWQELYWDANGTDWAYSFERVVARIHLDEISAEAFDGRTACYVGKYGDDDSTRCQTLKLDDGYEFRAKNLGLYENLTFVLGFKADTFAVQELPLSFLSLIPIVLNSTLAIATFVLIARARRSVKSKKKYYKNLPRTVEYIPPAGYTILEVASSYVGTGFYLRSKETAGLLELAVSHKIELIKNENVQTGIFSVTAPWRIRIKSLDLTREQYDILALLVPGASSLAVDQEITITRLSSIDTMARGYAYADDLNKTMLEKGLFTGTYNATLHHIRPSGPAKNIPAYTIAWAVYIFIFALIVAPLEGLMDGVLLREIIPFDTSFFISTMIAFVMPFIISFATSSWQKYAIRTEKALDLSRYLEGLYTYIKMAEADRLKMFQSVKGADTSPQGIVKLYERLLPYAALFGLEKSWLAELGHYYEINGTGNPSWYHSSAAFSAAEFSSTISSGTRYVSSSSFAHSGSSGSSSSSSGFSGGGGHSGGGGGGGGGGGW